MGVKDLWNILSPLSERKPLFELQGKAIAIDLSCWVVDSQTATDNVAQPRMYLRNLFFRTNYFLLHDIFPVFVLEGTAPSLKHNTIAKRNDIRHGAGGDKKKPQKGGRTRFNHVLKECEEMLNYMGLTCVKGHGEAEAMCAYLNADGLVDGCISQDSDCFLYGAKVVYRNFCTSTQGNRTTSGGSIDEYCMDKIQSVLNLGRNKMIALALMCGCDYDEGLNGVGKEAALKLFKVTEDRDILNRMRQWRTDSKFRRMEAEISNPDVCTSCGHAGKMRSHIRIGCVDCGTTVKCNDGYKEKRILISNELGIRKKALLLENFPSQELIDEFLVRKGSVPSKLDLKWKRPMIVKFICFMETKGLWEPAYAFAKIFPLVTRWQLINLIELPLEQRLVAPGVFFPEKIRKIRNIRSVASYEILWLDKDDILEGHTLMAPASNDESEEGENPDALAKLGIVTIEPQSAVLTCYPNIVEDFEALRNAKKKKPTRSRKKKTDDNEDPTEKKKATRGRKKKTDENDEESTEQKTKPVRKKRGTSKTLTEVTNNRKILDFVTVDKQPPASLEESFSSMTITPKRPKRDEQLDNVIPSAKKRGPQFDRVMTTERMDSILNGSLLAMFNQLTPEDFASDMDDDEDEMSLIIHEICGIKSDRPDVFVEYQENDVSPNSPETSPKARHNVLSEMEQDVDVDEFDMFDKTYVPLDMRLGGEKRQSKNRRSLVYEEDEERFSIGIDSLLNGTD